jgi:hypothetical protein
MYEPRQPHLAWFANAETNKENFILTQNGNKLQVFDIIVCSSHSFFSGIFNAVGWYRFCVQYEHT